MIDPDAMKAADESTSDSDAMAMAAVAIRFSGETQDSVIQEFAAWSARQAARPDGGMTVLSVHWQVDAISYPPYAVTILVDR